MTMCRFCKKDFQPLGIMRHEAMHRDHNKLRQEIEDAYYEYLDYESTDDEEGNWFTVAVGDRFIEWLFDSYDLKERK